MEFTGLLFGVIKSVGESCSAFCASSLENLAAVSRAHSFSEAVNLFTLDFLRLICSFHLSHLLLVFVKDILLQLHRLLYTETYHVVKHYFYFCAKNFCVSRKRENPRFFIGDLSLFNLNGESEINDIVVKQVLLELLRTAAV